MGPDPMGVSNPKVEGTYLGPATPYRIDPMNPDEAETIPRGRFEVDGRESVVPMDSLDEIS
jgi:hypothetical protein